MYSRFASSFYAVLLAALALTPVRADVLSLDGTGDYVTFPATGIPSGSNSFTIEAWINPTAIPTGGQDGGTMTFWGNQTANQANGFRLRGSTGVRHFFWANDHDENLTQDVLPDTSGPSSNGWHHFALTWNGAQTQWYWNGAPLGNPITAVGVSVAAANHRIGARLDAEYFQGYMDEVRIWNVARSAADIAANFQREMNGDEPGLVAYWNFEGNLVDRAGGDNNGTPLGNATTLAGLNAPVLPVGPRIYTFAASTNQILLAQSVTLSWAVSNSASVVIDQGIGAVSPTNSLVLKPTVTTTYTLTATNATGMRTAMATVMVDPGIPIAFNIVTNTPRGTPLSLTLHGSDPQGSNLTFAIVSPPGHGNLTGTLPNLTYTPTNNYSGLDTFTFKVNDGMFDSAPATVSINVIPPPSPPTGVLPSSTNISASAGPGAFIAALRAIDINIPSGDTHTFALVPGFGDNAKFTISGNVLSAGAGFAGGPGATFSVRIRVTDSTSFTFEQTITLSVVQFSRSVVINEIHHNSPQNTIHEEFIELYNPTDDVIDLSQWRLRGGIDFFFPANTFLSPHTFAVVAGEPATLLSRYGVTAFGPWLGGLNSEGEEVTLRDALDAVVDRVDFKSEFPWPIAADGDGASMQLVHPNLDNDLGSSWRSGTPPTPGATNIVFATNAAPNIRQVDHAPNTPASSNQVVITAKVTDPDGVASVTLAYQVVAPGSYIPATVPLTTAQLNNLNLTPTLTNSANAAFEASSNWVSVVMHDDGLNGDAVAGDDLYTVVLPPQANRTLLRYRITCTDTLGASRRAPFEDDPSLNFAYFVYDGIPNYLNFNAASLQTMPVYSLITRDTDLNLCAAWFNTADQLVNQAGPDGKINEGRLHFNWEGAVVYDGVVYDHVYYRLRGANGRYHPGKRSFRIRFNGGRFLDAKDNSGQRFPTKWRELTTGKGQSNRGGEQFALNEVVNFFLFNKVGVPAPETFDFHFRVIRGASEQGANQYSGDFWGLNWAQEKYDVNFLAAHHLPKGNLYKLVDNFVLGLDERRYQGPNAVTNAEDFFNIENNLDGFKSIDWLNAHANYTNWYRYFSIARAIRHYDTWPSANKNGAWYFEPLYGASNSFLGRVMQLPYDTTDTWGATWNTGDDVLYNGIYATTAAGGDAGVHPEMQLEFRNVAREMRTLLFQPDQIYPVIDAFAGVIAPIAPADLARWSNAPAPASYNSLLIAGTPGVTGGLSAYAQDMKNFMFVGGNNTWWASDPTLGNTVPAGGWITVLDGIIADTAIPNRPTATYIGTNGFPVDGLIFQSSAFSDPQGAGTFAAMQWRIAEVLSPGTVVSNPSQLRLEWDAAWDSGAVSPFNAFITIPAQVVQADLLYRVRVRHQDDTGRWSQWSLPVEFRPGPRDLFSVLRTNLVFSELMYNPPAEGVMDGDEFEFVELKNIGAVALNLTGLFFSQGVEFAFTNSTMLAPGATFLLARNPAALATRYPGVVVNGVYTGKLNNDGETLAISHPAAGEIISITYGDRAPWPVPADGFGFSLVRDAATGAYRASATRFGTPGADGAVSSFGGVVINEVLSSSTLPLKDTIELLNITTTNVDISSWYLSDDPSFPWKFHIPSGPPLVPGAFRVFTEDDFNPTPGLGVSFGLSSFGDDVYLFSADTGGQLTGYSHGFAFGAAQDGVSLGRYVNSVGEEQFPLQLSRTPGAVNTGPRIGPVVLSEIHYHPRAASDEFIELRNITSAAVPLYDPANPTNTWKLNGAGFTFPPGVTLAGNGCLLLVADAPAAFRARYGVSASVPILQFAGNLQDSGENLELQAPDLPTTNGVPYYAVDAVRFNDRKPWPLAADGAGASLQRINTAAYGNDPVNWLGAVPTPGTHGVSGTAPSVTSHPASRTNGTTTVATFSVSATGTAPLLYQWRFEGGNIGGATNSTLIVNNVQLTNAGVYQAVVFNTAGSTDSSNAMLTVRIGPSITAHPTNVALRVPPDALASPTNRATFIAGATTYNPPLRYQWQFNGTDITDATNSSLSFTNVQLANEGLYTAVVSDSAASAVSQPASFTGLVSPQITLLPIGQSVVVGAQVTLSAEVIGNPLPITFDWRRGSTTLASNIVNRRYDFFTFDATNVPQTTQYRVVVKNAANPAPGVPSAFINIVTLADGDADGIPDTWETAYGLNPSSAADAAGDRDEDGVSNLSEYLAGTNPTNASSFLRVEIISASAPATVSFGAVSNVTYTIQFSDVLGSSTWSKLADILARTNNRVETVIDPNWTTNRFYRAVTPRQP